MKKLHTGVIILDGIDIICISFSAGSLLAYGFKRYQKYSKYRRIKTAGEDPIVFELKQKSPINMFSEKGEPLKMPLMRGGYNIRGLSLMVKNEKVAKVFRAIFMARLSQHKIKLLADTLRMLNALSTIIGLRVAVGGSLNYVQIILFATPSTIGGFIMGMLLDHPLVSALAPILILVARGVKDVSDPYEKCRLLCEATAEYQNTKLIDEMKNYNSFIQEVAEALQLPLDQVPLIPIDEGPLSCVEDKLSLFQRYRLRSLLENEKAQTQVQYFSEFIKKFPDCDPNLEETYKAISEGIPIPIKIKK